jgi:thioredoxin 1
MCILKRLVYGESAMTTYYDDPQPSREEIDQLNGPVLLEFGAKWCGYCQALQPDLAAALARHPQVRHVKIEDGKGRPLGRSFRVRFWPTLIFMRDGQVATQLVRPLPDQVEQGFQSIL